MASGFVDKVRAEIQKIPLSCVANADQSGSSKVRVFMGLSVAKLEESTLQEMTVPRSLAPAEEGRAECTSHSYIILPLLFSDGSLGQYLFVVL